MADTSTIAEFQNDFRYKAMIASLERRREERITNPWDAAFSYCLPTGNSPRTFRRIQRTISVFILFCILIFFVSGIYALIAIFVDTGLNIPLLSVAFVFCGSVIGMILAHQFRFWLLDAYFEGRKEACCDNLRWYCISHVHIDNPFTYNPDSTSHGDYCYVCLDSKNSRLIIEGFLFRYQFYSEDVETFMRRQHGKKTAIWLSVNIADEEQLHLMLSREAQDTPPSEEVSNPGEDLFERISNTLDIDEFIPDDNAAELFRKFL
ncbi:MAG: hypothetical protein CMJ46_13990 [Planctomyces sp.]|nr:hypothetical protein [Planctomyces sp.]